MPPPTRSELPKPLLSKPEHTFDNQPLDLCSPQFEPHSNTNTILPPGLLSDQPSLSSEFSFQSLRCDGNSTPKRYTVAEPRLSPMEYARIYLIEKSSSREANRSCDLLPPRKAWFWTPGWREFLLLPKLPLRAEREPLSTLVDVSASVDADIQSSNSNGAQRILYSQCPRLSLNLGSSTSLLPSLLESRALPNVSTKPVTLHDTRNDTSLSTASGSGIRRLDFQARPAAGTSPTRQPSFRRRSLSMGSLYAGSRPPSSLGTEFSRQPSSQEHASRGFLYDSLNIPSTRPFSIIEGDRIQEVSSIYSQQSACDDSTNTTSKKTQLCPDSSNLLSRRGNDRVSYTDPSRRVSEEYQCNYPSYSAVSDEIAMVLDQTRRLSQQCSEIDNQWTTGVAADQESTHQELPDATGMTPAVIPELQPAPLRLHRRGSHAHEDKKSMVAAGDTGIMLDCAADNDMSIPRIRDPRRGDALPLNKQQTLRRTKVRINHDPFSPNHSTTRRGIDELSSNELRAYSQEIRPTQHSPVNPDYEPYQPRYIASKDSHHAVDHGLLVGTSEDVQEDPDCQTHEGRRASLLRRCSSKQSSFALERTKSHDAFTILPRSDARYFTNTDTHSSPESQQLSLKAEKEYQHPPRGSDQHSSTLRSDLTTSQRLSQGYAKESESRSVADYNQGQRTPSTSFSTLFRRRSRRLTPKTPTKPKINWKPFEEPSNGPPCSATWVLGEEEANREREDRAVFFKSKAGLGEVDLGFTAGCGDNQDATSLTVQSTLESRVGFMSMLKQGPVPSLAEAAAYKDKKPPELRIETAPNKLRKQRSKDVLRTPRSSTGLRTAFLRKGGEGM